jgi:hypothetical protein
MLSFIIGKLLVVPIIIRAMFILLTMIHMLPLPLALLLCMVEIGLKNHVVHHVPKKMCNEPTTVFHASNTSFVLSCKNEKVVARKLGAKCKGDKTCIWVPKVIVTNLVGPNKSWVPKSVNCLAGLCIRGLKLDYRQWMHKPHDGGEDVHLLRQEQGFPGFDHLWRWEPRQG